MFITVEGIDGSGKTTLLKKIAFYLKEKNHEFIITREPGGGEIPESIRTILLKDFKETMNPWTEALLYIASRKQHYETVILPNLKKGVIVISDRFSDSTLAYQGSARNLGIDELNQIQSIVFKNIKPDITFFLDLSPKEAIKRISLKSKKEINRFDLEKINFHKKVYEGYLEIIKKEPKRFFKLNANNNPEDIFLECTKILEKILEN